MLNILVFSACGHQGSATIKALLRHPHADSITKIRGFCLRESQSFRDLQNLRGGGKLECFKGDLNGPNSIREAMKDMNKVCLILNPVSLSPSRNSIEGSRLEHEIGQNIINFASEHHVDFVYSSYAACGTAQSIPTFKSKHDLEQCLKAKQSKFNSVSIVRPAWFFDNLIVNKTLVTSLAQGKLTMPLHPETKIPGVSIEDTGFALSQCLMNRNLLKFHDNVCELVGDVTSPNEIASFLQVSYEQCAPTLFEDKMEQMLFAFLQLEEVRPDLEFINENFNNLQNFPAFARSQNLLSAETGKLQITEEMRKVHQTAAGIL
ncbi:hypothetical protein GEMRC1_012795 [Eukaryota sp. GEM-RC1]